MDGGTEVVFDFGGDFGNEFLEKDLLLLVLSFDGLNEVVDFLVEVVLELIGWEHLLVDAFPLVLLVLVLGLVLGTLPFLVG